jgi:cytochrome P450
LRAPQLPTPVDALFGDDAIADPHPLYARLRSRSPFVRIGESGVHLVSSWALIDEALGREADFSANLTGVLVRGEGGEPAVFQFPLDGGSHVIATADEPEHAIHRALVQPRLAARRIEALEPELRSWVRAALDPFLARGGGDFIPIAETVPARAVARLLGLPEADVESFRRWSMMGGDILAGAIDSERLVALAHETGRMAESLSRHLEEAETQTRSDPDADAPLLHILARGIRDGRIQRKEAIGIAVILFGAGGESTAALLGSAVRVLAEQPELADRLRETPEQIPRFVEEIVRLETPFKFHYRTVRRTCALGGFELDRGDRLMLAWASANRDAEIFDHPDALRLDRRHPKQHMGFGRGAHFCAGAPLARLEARVLVECLLAGTSRLALSPDTPPAYARSLFVRRLEHLFIEVA